MLTSEQESFLADFADKGLAEIKEIEQRNIDNQVAFEKKLARDNFELELRLEKEQEIARDLALFDADQLSEKSPDPVILLDPVIIE